jgi:hypothetical protein
LQGADSQQFLLFPLPAAGLVIGTLAWAISCAVLFSQAATSTRLKTCGLSATALVAVPARKVPSFVAEDTVPLDVKQVKSLRSVFWRHYR